MAVINFQQTDTAGFFNVGCSGVGAGVTIANLRALVGGSAGTVAITADPDKNTTAACFNYDCGAPGVASWAAGDYIIPINFTTGDAGTTLNAVYVCDFDGASSYVTVASLTGLSDVSTGGVVTKTVTRGTAYTPQSQANSRPFIVIVLNNADTHGGSLVQITPSEIIQTPIDDGVVSIAIVIPTFTQAMWL